jgi:subtilisin-like proprotein convertase family protein
MLRTSKRVAGAITLVLSAHGLTRAVEVKKPEVATYDSLASREFFRPELSVSLGTRPAPVPEALAAIVGPDARLFVDVRSGAPTNLLAAIPMIPGNGTGNAITLEKVDAAVVGDLVRAFAVSHAAALSLDPADAGPSHAALVTPDLWHVRIPQVVDGIPVRYAHLAATISHGNMVLFGTEMWGDVAVDTHPELGATQAVDAGFAYAGGWRAGDTVVASAKLEIVPTAPQGDEGSYGHVLVWSFTFRREGAMESWEVLVDAHTGEIVSFQDTNQYEPRRIQGNVYPLTSTGICPTNTTCGSVQVDAPMPYADTGLPAPNNFADAAGLWDDAAGAATTTLDGRFVRMTDTCGPINVSSAGAGIDLGGVNGQHDCLSAGGSPGNTSASRSGYYELNKLIEMARGWLPANGWLQQKLTSNMNLVNTCNAFYDPGSGTINFYRSGGGCRNTGEIAAVFDHEWGHALDDNDSLGALSSSSEAYGDITAIYRLRTSCVGYGFFQTANKGCGMTADGTGFNQNESLTGSYCDTNCSGVRDTDWAKHVTNQPATPQNFVCGHCSSGPGPCGRQVHCSASPARQAAWDLVARDLPSPPLNMSQEDAFNLGAKLFFQGSGTIGSWHDCSCSAGTSSGCGATHGYMAWLAADDDDGNLSNGTPHMTAIFNAFNRHGIACVTPPRVNSGCASGPTAAPVVTTSSTAPNQITLNWTAVPNANRYRVLRTEGYAGCDFGKALIYEGSALSYADEDVADDRIYSYVVQAVGVSGACMGPGSPCASTAPVSCQSRLTLDRSTYNCADVLQIRLSDADLKNGGPQTVAVSSPAEATPEIVTLVETPPGTGLYRGSIPTSSAASTGAGVLKVADGGSATVEFVDASACGTPNVAVQRTAAIDCTGNACNGTFTLNKAAYTCLDGVDIILTDTDIAGAGSTAVDVTTGSETETFTLLESSPGTFGGSFTTRSASPGPNGIINVVHGQPMTLSYLDADGCGVPGSLKQKSVPVDCTGQGCFGAISTDRPVYTCSDSIGVSLYDYDLIGAGSKSISVSSTAETTPETIVLAESPVTEGLFVGTLPTAVAPTPGDGKIGGGTGATATLTYQDASACGIPNVTAPKAVTLDCAPPLISNVRADRITGSTARLAWATDEPSTTSASYGASAPPATPVPEDPALVTSHAVQLTGLAACSRVYYGVGSADAFAQSSQSDNGGQFYAFDVGTDVPLAVPFTNLPVTLADVTPTAVAVPFTVSDARTIADVNVKISVTHFSDGQLVVSLRHPDGTSVALVSHRGGSGDNFNGTVFDDEAASPITSGFAPFAGTFRPEGLLSVLDGKSAQGSWKLEVLDTAPGGAATITGIELQFALGTPCGPEEVSGVVWTDKSTLTWAAALTADTYTIFRGAGSGLPKLLTSEADSCARGATSSTSLTGLTDHPAPGVLHWWLVRGGNAMGSGSAGFATGGLRILDSTGPCP